MLLHYIKIALRNLRKYPAQTAISVLGLAAGFVCLSLSALWMHYENTYDTMHKDYERIYTFMDPWALGRTKYLSPFHRLRARPQLYTTLRDEFPEVEAVTSIFSLYSSPRACWQKVNGMDVNPIMIDSTFLQVFDLPLLQGDYDFITNPDKIALNEKYAKRLFPDETDVIGRKLTLYRERDMWGRRNTEGEREVEVGAVIKDFGEHSIFDFDIAYTEFGARGRDMHHLYAKLYEGVDVEAFAKKVADWYVPGLYSIEEWNKPYGTQTIQISDAHKSTGKYTLSLTWEYLQVFFVCSVLLVVCALINYLVLYLIRLRSREREMALRIVNGSTVGGLMVMFIVEVGIVLFMAMAFGLLGVEWLHMPFSRFTAIHTGYGYIMSRALWIMLITGFVCLTLCVIPIAIVRNRTLTGHNLRNDKSRKISSFVQLTVSMTFIFCSVVMIRQVAFMKNTDWGHNIRGRAQLHFPELEKKRVWNASPAARKYNEIAPHLRELPMVTELLEGSIDLSVSLEYNKVAWNIPDKISLSPGEDEVYIEIIKGVWDVANPSNGFTVLEGSLPRKEEWQANEIVVTDKVCRDLGIDNPIGQTVYTKRTYGSSRDPKDRRNEFTIVAVIKDIYYNPFKDTEATAILSLGCALAEYNNESDYLTITYMPNERKEFEHRVHEIMRTKFPDVDYDLVFSEDVFNYQLKSETNLMLILGIITAVCILVAVFGVYSIVTLACAQRRKEIALRKIHGATLADILSIFIKEYGLIVLAASAVAFPIGYMIMKEWVAQYVKQAPIAWWIYAVILLAIVLLIALSVGSRVWRTARENPAEVIKRGN